MNQYLDGSHKKSKTNTNKFTSIILSSLQKVLARFHLDLFTFSSFGYGFSQRPMFRFQLPAVTLRLDCEPMFKEFQKLHDKMAPERACQVASNAGSSAGGHTKSKDIDSMMRANSKNLIGSPEDGGRDKSYFMRHDVATHNQNLRQTQQLINN